MRHLVEHGLGHPLFVEQVVVVPGDLVALRQHGTTDAGGPWRGSWLPVLPRCGLGHEVIAARFQATHQGLLLVQRGEENDRHQRLAARA